VLNNHIIAKIEIQQIDLADDDDVVFLFVTRRNPEICKNLLQPPPESIKAHREWLSANVPGKRLMFILRADGQRVGYCHAYDFVGKDTVEVGFVVHPNHQRQGYGTKMVEMLIERLKLLMPQRKIVLFVRKGNYGATRFYKRMGFEEKWLNNETRFELEE
jgi:ribosomal protein S18 acetylase RimI-like enzyme